MLAESGRDQRARAKPLPNVARARHETIYIHNNQHNTQEKAMTQTYTHNKQTINKALTSNQQCVIIIM